MRLIILLFIFNISLAFAEGESGFKRACTSVMEYFLGHTYSAIAAKDLDLIIKNREEAYDAQEFLAPFKGQTFFSSNHQYILQKRIGHSSNDVYFAKSEKALEVAIKTQAVIENLWVYSVMHYEKEVTRFYQLKKLPIAQILDLHYDKNRPFYVVEYIRGVSLKGMKNYSQFFPEKRVALLEKELSETMGQFRKAHQFFAAYLKQKKIDLKSYASNDPAYKNAIEHLILEGDIREDQFLYNFEQSRWICIDP